MRAMLVLIVAIALSAGEPPALSAVPTNVQSSQQVSFGDDGAVLQDQSSVSFSLMLTMPSPARLLSSRSVTIDHLATEIGEVIGAMAHARGNSAWGQDQGQNGLQVQVTLPASAMGAARIVALRGTLTCAWSNGAVRRATLAPLRDFHGKNTRISGLDTAFSLRIREQSDGLACIFNGDETVLARLAFADATGADVPIRGMSGQGGGGQQTRVYQNISLPDGSVVLDFHHGMRTDTIPFTLADMPLRIEPPKPVAPGTDDF
ncbi:MAG: hypothetical protein H0X45_04520 [Planctomycetes bacterium]|nr:hypothetical protein [Planctomycetota bacterium]